MSFNHVAEAVAEWKARYSDVGLLYDYYDGRHQLKFATADWRKKYANEIGAVVLSIRENLCPVAVTAFTDGIGIEDWGSEKANTLADAAGLSRLEAMVNREAFTTGDAYVIVWTGPDNKPVATFQKSQDMIPRVDPMRPDRLLWAAKVWLDQEAGRARCSIYYADRVERWESAGTQPASSRDQGGIMTVSWTETKENFWRPATDEDGPEIKNIFGTVPVLWFKREAKDQFSHGISILNDVIPLQDGNNKSLADMIVTMEAFSRPFWYLLNHKPDTPEGNPLLAAAAQRRAEEIASANQMINVPAPAPLRKGSTGGTFDPNKQRIFTTDGPGPFGQLDPPDVTRLLTIQDGFALKIARTVGFPSYYITQTSGDVPSGESLRVLSARRTSRVKAWHRDASPVWRGLKQLMGMGEEPVSFEPPMALDPMDEASIASTKKNLGYAMYDYIQGLEGTDDDVLTGIIDRADSARQTTMTDISNAWRAGDVNPAEA